MQKRIIPKPSLFHLFGEPIWVWRDIWRSQKFRKVYNIGPSGDGHPVLVIPGLLGNDTSTAELRKFIRSLGYSVYGWEMGLNLGDIRQLSSLLDQVEKLQVQHQQKVSIIGWSLGGVYARELGKRRPELVRQIITLAAPFADIEQSNYATWFYKLINYRRPFTETEKAWIKGIIEPAPVPTTALYSKRDGIVHWRACMEQAPGNWHQNIEIVGSHLGMPYIPSSWVVIEDRLRLNQENWQLFEQREQLPDLVVFPSL